MIYRERDAIDTIRNCHGIGLGIRLFEYCYRNQALRVET